MEVLRGFSLILVRTLKGTGSFVKDIDLDLGPHVLEEFGSRQFSSRWKVDGTDHVRFP